MKVEIEKGDIIKLRKCGGRLFRIIRDKNQTCVKMVNDYRKFTEKIMKEEKFDYEKHTGFSKPVWEI